MMTRTIVRCSIAVVVVAVAGLGARAALANAWGNANCDGGAQLVSIWKRSQAIDYAQPPLHEGYALGGGCYRLNDRDDTPLLAADEGGEGADCSGFTFRVWALKLDGSSGYRTWDYDKDVHGPFLVWDYYNPNSSTPFRQISKDLRSTAPMDAFAWYRDGGDDRHIALLYQQSTSSDLMIHAHNNTVGVEISEEIYRQYPDVKALSRRGWTPECYPKCPDPSA
jgi:hypothetical protein